MQNSHSWEKKNRVVLVIRQLLIWYMSTHMAICMSAFFWCSQLLNKQGNRGHMITRFILCFRMGQTLSEPVTTKDTSSCSNKLYKVGSSCMQGWRISILFVAGFSLIFVETTWLKDIVHDLHMHWGLVFLLATPFWITIIF